VRMDRLVRRSRGRLRRGRKGRRWQGKTGLGKVVVGKMGGRMKFNEKKMREL
jgi:hypothetical protein